MKIAREYKDILARRVSLVLAVGSSLIVIAIAATLLWRARALFSVESIAAVLFGCVWRPSAGHFGLLPFALGSAAATVLAMLLAIPTCILTAIYLAYYAAPRVRRAILPTIDLLAGVPSVVHGLWGVLFVVPILRSYVGPWFGRSTSGYSLLAAAIVLAVMVSPIIVSVSDDVLRSVPREMLDASLSLGATRWQTVKHVALRRATPGIAAAVALGFSRAFGETMAVMMVIGNVGRMPRSILEPAATLPSLIANNYGEIMSIPLYDSALLFAALVLMVFVAVFNVAARFVLRKMTRRQR